MKSTARIVLHVVGALFGALAIVFAIGAWRLSSGPLSLGFLSPYIEDALREVAQPYLIKFEDTILTWAGWERTLDIRVTDMRISSLDGETLLTVPAVSLGLSGAALLRGVLAPSSIELMRPSLSLLRQRDGGLHLAAGSGEGAEDDTVDALVADLLNPPHEDHPLARLEHVSVLDAHLTVADEATGLLWTAPKADLVFDLDETEIVGLLSLDVRVQDLETHVEVLTFHDRKSKLSSASVTFSELSPAQLAVVSPELERFSGIRVPFSGTLSFDLAPGGVIEGVDFDIVGEAGEITLPEVLSAPVPVRRLAAAGTVDDDLSRIILRSSRLDTDRPRFSLNGVIRQTEAGVGVRGQFQVVDMPFDSLRDYWPETVIGDGRRWILRNVADGVITRLDVALDVEPGTFEDDRFSATSATGTFAFEDTSIHYLRPMPPVEGVDGFARFTGESLDLTMSDGRLFGITASRATARLSDIRAERPRMRTIIEAKGPALDALSLLDYPRLALARKVGLRPEQVGGTVHTLFAVDLPLIDDLEAEQIDLTAVARVRDARVDALAGMVDVTQGALRISLDAESMELLGTAEIQGTPATIAWRASFGDEAPFASRYEVSMTVTPEVQAALGVDLAPYAQGSFALDAVITDPGPQAPRAAITLDLRNARLEIPEFFWVKPEGEEGRARILAEFPPDGGVELTTVDVWTKSFHGVGRTTLGPGLNGVRDIAIERIRHGATDIAGRVEATGDASMRVSITGASLDARPYLERLMAGDTPASGSFILNLNVERLLTTNNQELTDARVRIVTDASGRHGGFLEGTLSTGEPFRLFLEPMGAKRRLIVRSGDAGAVARAFGIYDNAVGGRLLMEAIMHDDLPGRPITGAVTIHDYRVINAPTLAELLSVATLTGILDGLRGEGIAFSTFVMPFSIVNDVLIVEDAKAAGLSIGLNAEGTVDLETGEADMRGTIVPAYALNSIVGTIPLLGELLVGGEGEGLFAATYRAVGSIDEPTVVVNPLAALAPGILRNLFSFLEGDEPADGGGVTRD